MPSADDFAALARSSPWLWSTLRFTLHHRMASGDQPPVRAWLRRPDRGHDLHIEAVDEPMDDALFADHRPPRFG